MNAIKMPVEAGKQPFSRSMWRVLDDDGDVVARDLSEDVANQIALALNCHDALVEALKGVVAVADRKTVEFDAAQAALAKVEDLRKNQQQTT